MRVTWIVVAVILAASGCGVLNEGPAATDEEIALAGIIRLSDFPPGWRDEGEAIFVSSAEYYGALDESNIEQIGGCPKLEIDGMESTEAVGHRITRNDVTISSHVGVHPTAELAQTAMAAYSDERTIECEAKAWVKETNDWSSRPKIRAGRLSSTIEADQVVVIQAELTSDDGKRWVREERRVRIGSAVITVFTSRGWDADHDSTVSDEVTQKAVDRVRERLG